MTKSSKHKKQEITANKKIVPVILIIVGAACLLGAGIFFLDSLTAAEPVGLGNWIFDILGLALGAGASFKGWKDVLKKDETATPSTRIVAMDDAQVATGENGRNIKQGDDSNYFEGGIHYHEATIEVTKTVNGLFTIPPPVRDFTGRKAQLAQLKASVKNGAVITGVSGGGGVGKSELVRQLAQEIADDYPDARMSIDLRGTSESPLSSDEAMRRILEPFRPNQKLPDGPEQLNGLYQQTFSEQKALLLLDNAVNAMQVRPLIPPAPSAAIITSRHHFSLTEFGLSEPLRLDVLSSEESRALLRTASPKLKESSNEEVDALAKLCGHLPLALRVAASILNDRTDWTLGSLLKRLGDERTRLQRLKREDDIDLNVEATLSLSYELLDDELKKKFRQLGVFTSPFINISVRAVWQIEGEDEIDRLIGKLTNLSLLNILPSPFEESLEREIVSLYALHDLTCLFAMSLLLKDENEAAQAIFCHASHFLQWASWADNLYLKGNENTLQGIDQFRFIWQHLESAYVRLLPEQKFFPRPPEADEWLSDFPGRCSSLLGLYLTPRQKIPILESALYATRRLGQKQMESVHLGNLGMAYTELGDSRKAIEIHEQALVISREIGDRRGEGADLSSIGIAYLNLGNARTAIESQEQALMISRENGDRRGEGNTLGNLGNAYAVLGEVRTAIKYHEQALVISREVGDIKGESADLGGLGNAYLNMGDARKAIELYGQVLIISREIGDRSGEGAALGNLGLAYVDLREFRKAIDFFEQVLAISRENGNRSSEGSALCSLGIAYGNLGNMPKAIGSFKQALMISHEIGDRGGEGNVLINLGNAYRILGEREKAKKVLEEALAIFHAIESPHVVIVEKWLADLDREG